MKFIIACTKNESFIKACPVSQNLIDRREHEELVLRFFAYSDEYKKFRHDVGHFLDKFLSDRESDFDKKLGKGEFIKTMEFVERYFPSGFAKSKTAKTTPRVRFEAISVGVNLALREEPNLVPRSMEWLDSREFLAHTTTHASNSGPKLRGRVGYVRDQLLKV
ncbi:MAG: hypothetical protein GY820_33510 [Gammaproteobacteria bacterium]|nr:hypothetical protein [Gammaproteobacteria bacterium]